MARTLLRIFVADRRCTFRQAFHERDPPGRIGKDIVMDFDTTMDILDISALSGVKGFSDLMKNHAVEKSGNLVITYYDDAIILKNIGKNDLGTGDFTF